MSENNVLNIETITENLSQFSSQKLSEMIVSVRYFKLDQEIALLCMKELSDRRSAGESFSFEEYIEKSLLELPKLDFDLFSLKSVLTEIVNTKK